MRFAQILLFVVGGIVMITPAWGQGRQDRVSFGRNIVIERGESVADAVCLGCSIRVDGTVRGDAVTVGGRTTVSGRVDGDVVAVGGGIR